MRWVRDASGRFPKRPHYAADELEQVCAELLHAVRAVRPSDQAPVSTDDLTVLIEQHAADLDLFADLDPELDAVTDFVPGQRPRVRVAESLSREPRRATRLRTTLAHELAHVVLHNFLWWFDSGVAFEPAALSPRCVLRRVSGDWMEWQANYVAGALLMPSPAVAAVVGAREPLWVRSARAADLARAVQSRFEVSREAARIRLQQLGHLTERPRAVARAPTPRW